MMSRQGPSSRVRVALVSPALELRIAARARRRAVRRRVAVGVGILAAVVATTWAGWSWHHRPLMSYSFTGPDRLVTNEHRFWHQRGAVEEDPPDWSMTSGSLFVRGGVGWSGRPDVGEPGPDSGASTNSAVFRLNTARRDFGDVEVSFRLRVLAMTSTVRTPPNEWDGVHVWLRYQSEYELYYASVARRDGVVTFKKKMPGGRSNDGTYHPLGEARGGAAPGRWAQVRVSVRNRPDGSVALAMSVDGRSVLTAVDHGEGGAPIVGAGSVGIRGDNCEFELQDFVVSRS